MYKIYNNSLEYSGNNSTLNRLNKILSLINGKNSFTNKIEDKLIGIHAYKFGKLVYDKEIDYILIIGGTDVNEDVNDSNKKNIIIKSIENAKYIICFNNFLYNKVKFLCPKIDNKIKIIPQSVEELPVNKEFNLMKIIKNKTGKEYSKIYAMVGNIRSVKDPLYLEKIFNSKLKNYLLILLGNVIEDGLVINETDNFIKLDPIDSIYLKSFYSQIDGLINCSKSEGMSGSILEAMFYGCPVYARNIEGNIALIEDQVTGYIFSEPEEIIELFENPIDNIIINARQYISESHSFKLEEDLYKKFYFNNNVF
jgi:glycosyltransferase involved in cell wall biosynthesis